MLAPVLDKIQKSERYIAGFHQQFLKKKEIPPAHYAEYGETIRHMRTQHTEFHPSVEEAAPVEECRKRIISLFEEIGEHLKSLKQTSSAKKEKEK